MATTPKPISEFPLAEAIASNDLLVIAQYVDVGPVYTTKSIEAGSVLGNYVERTGDVMYDDDEETGFTLQPFGSNFNLASLTNEGRLSLNLSTADPTVIDELGDSVGDVVAGRFRFSFPILELTEDDFTSDEYLINSSNTGAYIIVDASGTEAVQEIVLRKNNGTAGEDFFLGNSMVLVQAGSDTVGFAGEDANVNLVYPADKLPQTRGEWSVIRATLFRADALFTSETWVIEGDLADIPP
jgi:hypothetical protein